ncbi:MAG: CHC2 zinc finger domain-containing protein [Nitrospira sp.]|nr:hypothetical protein [Nitrospira sp.]HQY59318.1 CHC2 zinc finger domain-containing protein [Nitrospira sp.]HRA97806.1 CHC2 zinc finger domain-containing protein [Nitrospira sp.]
MFTRRMLFKTLAVIGTGSLFSAESDGADARCSSIGPLSSIGHLAMSGDSSSDIPVHALDVSATEQWENLLDDLDAAELIGRYITLKPTPDGINRITGSCPFCRHGTDSLLVDGRDDSYFCTDCLAGGHALDFYARMEGRSLSESVRQVTGLMASEELQGKRARLKRFHCIIDEIDHFAWESLICRREGASARGWLDQQGVTAGTAERFSIRMMSYALGKQLLARLRVVGFSPDEVEQAGVNGWLSRLEDRLKAGESDNSLLLPVRDREGHCCGFYEQSIGPDVPLTWSSHVYPYGYQLLSPHRSNRLVFSASKGRDFPSSVVLAERPWDVVLLVQGGMAQAVYVTPLDFAEYRDRLGKFLMCARTVIWPIHQSELNVGFLRQLFSLPSESIARLTFLLLPEGESLPGLLRREGIAALQARLARAVSVKGLVGG